MATGGDWLGKVGLSPRTASTWMRLAALGITAEDVVARGGINATLKPTSAIVADVPVASDLQRELAEAEVAIGSAKRGYDDALDRRQRLLRALARADRAPNGQD